MSSGPNSARYAACVYATEAVPTLLVSDPQDSVDIVKAQIQQTATLRGTNQIGKLHCSD